MHLQEYLQQLDMRCLVSIVTQQQMQVILHLTMHSISIMELQAFMKVIQTHIME